MNSYEILEILPPNPWYVRGPHFFKGLQIAVVQNLEDVENDEHPFYQQPLCTFYGHRAKAMAKEFVKTLHNTGV